MFPNFQSTRYSSTRFGAPHLPDSFRMDSVEDSIAQCPEAGSPQPDFGLLQEQQRGEEPSGQPKGFGVTVLAGIGKRFAGWDGIDPDLALRTSKDHAGGLQHMPELALRHVEPAFSSMASTRGTRQNDEEESPSEDRSSQQSVCHWPTQPASGHRLFAAAASLFSTITGHNVPSTASRARVNPLERRMTSFVKKNKDVVFTATGRVVKLSTDGFRKQDDGEDGDDDQQSHTRLGYVHQFLNKRLMSRSWWTSVDDDFTGKVNFKQAGEALHPQSRLSRTWNTLLIATMVSFFVVTPLRAGFEVNSLDVIKWWQLIGSFLLCLDIPISLFRGYDMDSTLDYVELQPLRTVLQYAKTWLVFDMLVSIPWEWVWVPWFVNDVTQLRRAVPTLHLLRWTTLYARPSYLSMATLHMKYSKRAIISFGLFLAVVSHCMACMWMLLALLHLAHDTQPDPYARTWLSSAGVNLEEDSLQSKYIQAIYFSVTIMATIGFGDIVPQNGPERVLGILSMIVGTWAYAYSITQVAEQVAHMQGADVRFKEHQDSLLEYMNARNVPVSLQRRMLLFYEFQRRHAAVFHREDEILQNLPPRMHAEVKQHANRDTVKLLGEMPLFKHLDVNLLHRLIVALRTQFLPPNELVCVEGEVGRHLFIIRKGTVEVMVKGKRVAIMTDGQSFGETVLFQVFQGVKNHAKELFASLQERQASTEGPIALPRPVDEEDKQTVEQSDPNSLQAWGRKSGSVRRSSFRPDGLHSGAMEGHLAELYMSMRHMDIGALMTKLDAVASDIEDTKAQVEGLRALLIGKPTAPTSSECHQSSGAALSVADAPPNATAQQFSRQVTFR